MGLISFLLKLAALNDSTAQQRNRLQENNRLLMEQAQRDMEQAQRENNRLFMEQAQRDMEQAQRDQLQAAQNQEMFMQQLNQQQFDLFSHMSVTPMNMGGFTQNMF